MDVTQILLAIIGATSAWALKSVIEQQRQIAVLESQLKGLERELAIGKEELNRRLEDLKRSIDDMAKKFDQIFRHRRASDKGEEDE